MMGGHDEKKTKSKKAPALLSDKNLWNAGRGAAAWLVMLVFLAGFARMTVIRAWNYQFVAPCRLEADCAGEGISMEQIKEWEEWAKEGKQGITAVAGWRMEEKKTVSATATGRSHEARPAAVYGNMALAFPAKILSGSYGSPEQKDSCVLSEDLADALFGSRDVAGEEIYVWQKDEAEKGKKRYIVAGVIKKEGEYLLLPSEEGEIDGVAVQFDRRFQAKEKMDLLLFTGV